MNVGRLSLLGIKQSNGESLKTNYKKLWKKLIDRDMTRTDLRQAAGISSSSLAKLGKGEIVTSAVYSKICVALECEMSDILPANILDYIKDRKQTISH